MVELKCLGRISSVCLRKQRWRNLISSVTSFLAVSQPFTWKGFLFLVRTSFSHKQRWPSITPTVLSSLMEFCFSVPFAPTMSPLWCRKFYWQCNSDLVGGSLECPLYWCWRIRTGWPYPCSAALGFVYYIIKSYTDQNEAWFAWWKHDKL